MSNILYIMLSHGLTVFKSIRSFNPCLPFLIHKHLYNMKDEQYFVYYALAWSHGFQKHSFLQPLPSFSNP